MFLYIKLFSVILTTLALTRASTALELDSLKVHILDRSSQIMVKDVRGNATLKYVEGHVLWNVLNVSDQPVSQIPLVYSNTMDVLDGTSTIGMGDNKKINQIWPKRLGEAISSGNEPMRRSFLELKDEWLPNTPLILSIKFRGNIKAKLLPQKDGSHLHTVFLGFIVGPQPEIGFIKNGKLTIPQTNPAINHSISIISHDKYTLGNPDSFDLTDTKKIAAGVKEWKLKGTGDNQYHFTLGCKSNQCKFPKSKRFAQEIPANEVDKGLPDKLAIKKRTTTLHILPAGPSNMVQASGNLQWTIKNTSDTPITTIPFSHSMRSTITKARAWKPVEKYNDRKEQTLQIWRPKNSSRLVTSKLTETKLLLSEPVPIGGSILIDLSVILQLPIRRLHEGSIGKTIIYGPKTSEAIEIGLVEMGKRKTLSNSIRYPHSIRLFFKKSFDVTLPDGYEAINTVIEDGGIRRSNFLGQVGSNYQVQLICSKTNC